MQNSRPYNCQYFANGTSMEEIAQEYAVDPIELLSQNREIALTNSLRTPLNGVQVRVPCQPQLGPDACQNIVSLLIDRVSGLILPELQTFSINVGSSNRSDIRSGYIVTIVSTDENVLNRFRQSIPAMPVVNQQYVLVYTLDSLGFLGVQPTLCSSSGGSGSFQVRTTLGRTFIFGSNQQP